MSWVMPSQPTMSGGRCFIVRGMNLDYLFKVVRGKFLSVELLFSFVNDLWEIPCDYENILFLLKLLTTNFSSHLWVLPMTIML